MVRNQVAATVPFAYPLRHASPKCQYIVAVNIAIAPQYPNNGFVPVTLSQEFAINGRIFCIKNNRPCSWVDGIHFVAPSWQHPDREPQFFRFVDYKVHMLEISLIGLGRV